MKFRRFVPALFLIVLCPVACNRDAKPKDLPKLYPLSVTVKQNDLALPGASVNLYSEDSSFKWVLGGVSDQNGCATIRTQGKFPGAPEGKYKVAVAKISDDGKSCDLVNVKFGSLATTDLEIEVRSGKNAGEFELGEPVRVPRKKAK